MARVRVTAVNRDIHVMWEEGVVLSSYLVCRDAHLILRATTPTLLLLGVLFRGFGCTTREHRAIQAQREQRDYERAMAYPGRLRAEPEVDVPFEGGWVAALGLGLSEHTAGSN